MTTVTPFLKSISRKHIVFLVIFMLLFFSSSAYYFHNKTDTLGVKSVNQARSPVVNEVHSSPTRTPSPLVEITKTVAASKNVARTPTLTSTPSSSDDSTHPQKSSNNPSESLVVATPTSAILQSSSFTPTPTVRLTDIEARKQRYSMLFSCVLESDAHLYSNPTICKEGEESDPLVKQVKECNKKYGISYEGFEKCLIEIDL